MVREFEISSVISCPVCNSQKLVDIIEKYDDRFGQPDMFSYAHCSECNTIFLKNKIVRDQMSELYGKYYKKSVEKNFKSNVLKTILKMIRLDGAVLHWLAGNIILLEKVEDVTAVLEIGSGYGPDLKQIILKKKMRWMGLEVDAILVQRIKNEGLNALQGTVDDLDKMKIGKFDYIILSQSLEHQFDINVFFENSRKILNENGRIIFTTPNTDSRYKKKYSERWINWHPPYHVTLLSRKSIEFMCKKYGYRITKHFTYTPTSWYMLQNVFTIPQQGQKNEKFNFNFSLLKQLGISLWLRILDTIDRKRGDCIYCEIKLNN